LNPLFFFIYNGGTIITKIIIDCGLQKKKNPNFFCLLCRLWFLEQNPEKKIFFYLGLLYFLVGGIEDLLRLWMVGEGEERGGKLGGYD